MGKASKRYRNNLGMVDRGKSYSVPEAVDLLKSMEPGNYLTRNVPRYANLSMVREKRHFALWRQAQVIRIN